MFFMHHLLCKFQCMMPQNLISIQFHYTINVPMSYPSSACIQTAIKSLLCIFRSKCILNQNTTTTKYSITQFIHFDTEKEVIVLGVIHIQQWILKDMTLELNWNREWSITHWNLCWKSCINGVHFIMESNSNIWEEICIGKGIVMGIHFIFGLFWIQNKEQLFAQ